MGKIALRQINPRNYDKVELSPEEILSWFENEDAYWIYEGEPTPKRPHAELTSGLCSNGYFDVPRLLRYPNVAEILGRQLGRRLREKGFGRTDWVVSSAYAAITFGHEVAKELGAVFAHTEKDPADPRGKRMSWRRMTIPTLSKVLQVEELVTTSGTFQEVMRAVEEGNQKKPLVIYDYVGTLVHRPAKLPVSYSDRGVLALIEKEIHNFEPAKCPYCRAGSKCLRPKENWAELTGLK